jgi:subtilisin family serine protease
MAKSAPLHRVIAACLIVFGVVVTFQVVAPSQSQPSSQATEFVNGHEAVAGEVLVQFAGSTSMDRQLTLEQQIQAVDSVPVGQSGLRRFRSPGYDVDTLLAFFRAQPDVAFAEPNYIVRKTVTPNDPQFSNLWGLLNVGQIIQGVAGTPGSDISATAAWNTTKGSKSIVVGVIDTGVDFNHPDLAANMWSAPSAFTVNIGGVSITCPAGSRGFNAITNACNPMDDEGHGTHVSGTIGAVGNNGIGVAGVNWNTSIIGAKFLNSGGSGTTQDAIDAIDFLIQVKAAFASTGGANIRVLNNSWGGGGFSTGLQNAIANANTNNMLFVAAAGNSSNNNDTFPFYPASYNVDNVVAVAATDNQDFLAWFSNYGAQSVDLAAPGVDILSTVPGGGYAWGGGTSMASPHVAGAAALVLSACNLNTAGVKQALRSSVDPVASLANVVDTDGRLNVAAAISSCGTPTVPPAPTGLAANAGNGQVSLSWGAVGTATSYRVKRATTSGGPYTTIATGLTSTSHLDTSVTNGTTYFYVVSAVNGVGEGPNSSQVSATPSAAVNPPQAPTALTATAGDAKVTLNWTASNGATGYQVQRSTKKAGPFTEIAAPTATTYIDTTVNNGTKYWYRVRAVNNAGVSAFSNKVSATPTGGGGEPPPPPR